MSPSAQLTFQQQKEIFEDERKTGHGAQEVQEQMYSEQVLNPNNTSSVLTSVLNTINNEFEYECLEEAVRLQNAHLMCQSIDDRVPGHKYSIPDLPRTSGLEDQVWAIWFIMRRWVWDADMPGAPVVDEMGVAYTFTSVAAAMICKLLTEKVLMGILLSIVWGNIVADWVNMVQNDFPRIICEEQVWYPLQRHYSVPNRLTEIQGSPPQGHPGLTSTLEPMLVAIMP